MVVAVGLWFRVRVTVGIREGSGLGILCLSVWVGGCGLLVY